MLANQSMVKKSVLAIIPARAGSKRVPRKNIRHFLGRPLLAYAVAQALDSSVIDRVIVDTDSKEIATIARRAGADVPFLRPAEFAQDSSRVLNSVFYLLQRLEKEEGYVPSHVLVLQTTSPLRELEDIKNCWDLMLKTKATAAVTVCATRPKPKDLAWLNKNRMICPARLAMGAKQSVLHGYNGFVFLVKTSALLKEKQLITKKTTAVVCPEWRSIDIDVPEDWVLAELLFKNRTAFNARLKKLM